MLLAMHMLALGVGTIMFFWMMAVHHRARTMQSMASPKGTLLLPGPEFTPQPAIWLAIRSFNPKAIQAVLGISYPSPCPWAEGIAGVHEFFIGPPVNEWIIVTGSGLPHPGHDVDSCFHFLIRLSRVLGEVQFFLADPILHHHAWARVENGVVQRAHAWTGETVWNQGVKSLAEIELNMKSFGYGEEAGIDAAANAKKVSSLAARWSFDPTAMDRNLKNPADGIACKASRFCQD